MIKVYQFVELSELSDIFYQCFRENLFTVLSSLLFQTTSYTFSFKKM